MSTATVTPATSNETAVTKTYYYLRHRASKLYVVEVNSLSPYFELNTTGDEAGDVFDPEFAPFRMWEGERTGRALWVGGGHRPTFDAEVRHIIDEVNERHQGFDYILPGILEPGSMAYSDFELVKVDLRYETTFESVE